MKPRQSKPRTKLSFAVDRDEIEINSDWVSAVMAPASLPRGGAFLAPGENNTTGAEKTSGEVSATGEGSAPVEKVAAEALALDGVGRESTVAVFAPVESLVSVVDIASGANDATVALTVGTTLPSDVAGPVAGSSDAPPVAHSAPVDHIATVEPLRARKARPRPLRRVTDGLTTGQYAVYSLMFEHGTPNAGPGERLYRGGYADLCALTGLSKRGVQNVVGELHQKGVISRDQMPGHHRTETSIYRVPAPDNVVHAWLDRGLRFAFGKSKTLAHSATVAL